MNNALLDAGYPYEPGGGSGPSSGGYSGNGQDSILPYIAGAAVGAGLAWYFDLLLESHMKTAKLGDTPVLLGTDDGRFYVVSTNSYGDVEMTRFLGLDGPIEPRHVALRSGGMHMIAPAYEVNTFQRQRCQREGMPQLDAQSLLALLDANSIAHGNLSGAPKRTGVGDVVTTTADGTQTTVPTGYGLGSLVLAGLAGTLIGIVGTVLFEEKAIKAGARAISRGARRVSAKAYGVSRRANARANKES